MPSSGSDRSRRRRVRIVDDEPIIAELISDCLASSPEPLDVVKAGNGRAALEAVERTRPDLVLLDINMPVMDGLETLKRLRVLHPRSEEHTSELQSHSDLVCRLLLEKKKKKKITQQNNINN